MLNVAQLDAENPIAAMPSRHTAFATLCAGFLIPRVAKRWRPLLAYYPLAMMLSLVYSGEHCAVDTLIGVGYAVVILLATTPLERRWHRRHPAPGRGHADADHHADTDSPDVAAFTR